MVKMPPGAEVCLRTDGFFCLVNTDDETTVICPSANVPSGAVEVNAGWVGFKVQGPMDFGMVGVMANLSKALAESGISLIAISTFDTDWILVRKDKTKDAAIAWQNAGHEVLDIPHNLHP